MVWALADLPDEVVPLLGSAMVVAVLAFLAHPSSLRDKVRRVAPPSAALGVLLLLAAVPLLVYARGQLGIHLGSGSADEHFEFGHWIVMTVVSVLPLVYGALAPLKVSGWRFALWAAGFIAVALGVGSLGITSAVSQLATGWALLAILWGVAFVTVGELEARNAPATEGIAPAPA